MKNALILILAIIGLPFLTDAQKEVSLKPFKSLEVGGSITIELIHGSSNKAIVTMEKGDYDDLEIEVEGDELSIEFDKGWRMKSQPKATIKLYYSELNGIDVSAGAKVTGSDMLKASEMELEASSGGHLSVQIECDALEAEVSSGGSISVSGKADGISAEASSGGSFSGAELATQNADLDASSGGSIKVMVSKTLKAEASSGGTIKYKGDPELLEMNNKYSSIKKI
jgi:hypothetical protein